MSHNNLFHTNNWFSVTSQIVNHDYEVFSASSKQRKIPKNKSYETFVIKGKRMFAHRRCGKSFYCSSLFPLIWNVLPLSQFCIHFHCFFAFTTHLSHNANLLKIGGLIRISTLHHENDWHDAVLYSSWMHYQLQRSDVLSNKF